MQASRMLTLTGAGGIGKTRLALAVAHECALEYPQGAWWVELAALTEGQQVHQAIASVLGLRESAKESLLQTLLGFLQHRHVLLVLDNCEHLLADCTALCNLVITQCAGVRLLATSRQALGLSGELAWQVPSLSVPPLESLSGGEQERLEVVRASAAAQLLVERAKSVQRTFVLTAKNALPIAQICARLDGLPLALELVATRVTVLSVEQIATRLDKLLPLLTRGSASAPTRQQTLRALIDWSYELLSGPEKVLLQRLAVFQGGWTLEAAEYLSSHAELETLDLLSNLIERSLVLMETTEAGLTRYRMLETIRQYASEKLHSSAESEAIQQRHADYFLLFAEAQLPQMNSPEETTALDSLETEYDNLRGALRFSLWETTAPQTALRLIVALHPFWDLRSYLREGLEWALKALEHPVLQQPTVPRAKALAVAGNLALGQGDYEQGNRLLEEGLALCRHFGERKTLATTLNTLAAIRGQQGNLEAQSRLLEESLALHQESNNTAGMALVYGNRGCLARRQGDFERAQGFQQQSLALGQAMGDKRAMAWSLNNLGTIALDQANYTEAHAYFERSLFLRREIGDKAGVADTVNDLGCIALERGEYETAQPYFEESVALQEERGNRDGVALALSNLGAVFMMLGNLERASDSIQRSLVLCREQGNLRSTALALHHLGDLATLRKDSSLALLHYKESLALFEKTGNQFGMAHALNSLGHTLCAINDLEGAHQQLTACLRLCEETGNMRCAEYALENGARLAFLSGEPEKALRLCSAVEVLRTTKDHPLSPKEKEDIAAFMAQTRAALPTELAAQAWEAGQKLTMGAAIAEVTRPRSSPIMREIHA